MTPVLARSPSVLRSLAYALRRALAPDSPLVADVPALGLSFALPARSGLARHLYKYRSYEPHVGNWVLANFPFGGGGLFVDIGANFGWYACLFSLIAGERGKVVAFEPEPVNHGLLKANLSRNGCPNVIALQEGLAERPGVLSLRLYKPSNPGRHSMLGASGADAVEVPVTTLDERLRALALDERPIDLIKIDVEGYEPFVLRGGPLALSRCRNLVVEYSPDLMRQGGVDPASLVELLASTGMRASVLQEGGPVPVDPVALLSMGGQVDLLWQRIP
ncbi:FkbM family methyltransferase [Burkholderiaceae bacterium FT117]|uniref:FkbM family methyltransferase n=1 Tax=Zeimonas sediminis TaxID=2944268 RepID=UPI002342F9C4|nr:FkbM family methyltransferase [Zeimonas sediminis]MCM5570374.1 FkbM family methyltransferase [Zeimonas sediminis]